MVEHQIICKILEEKSLAIIYDNGITLKLFPADYQEELGFIIEHYNTYGNIPDTLSFLSKFNDFDIVEVTESDSYLIDKLMETILYQKQLVLAGEYGEKLGEADSRNALEYLKQQMEELRQIEGKSTRVTDIVKDVVRGEEYTNKVKREGIVGITTGSNELDEVLHGWLEEDLIIILGRTNEGKSWILQYFLVVAWQQGYKVLLYSGEMSEEIIGYRFDTLNKHFSNNALMSGKESLGDNLSQEDYQEYLKSLTEVNKEFAVVTPKSLGKRLDMTILRYLVDIYQPDIIGIDQISLMDDVRSGNKEQLRIKFSNIASDLYELSGEKRIPILAPSQANRGAESKNKEDDQQEPPEVHEISESDGVGQNATRVISLKVNGVQLKLKVAKNRYGQKGHTSSFLWDIDRGIVKPFTTPKHPDAPPQNNAKQESNPNSVLNEDVTSGEELF